ncbi:geranylgeranyl diphosphate synthase type I [Jatrophihabitans sp. GAS493]|uniref:polyprenyl synthetase family protein n=1 Tax=Jatrophihabitans sp. GAS493 TaxID=1907575 RepID=UPI000BBF8A3F|nr:polyprenyl synthetase family protein [Jatrophihabitans sp. GAS493]SOD72416.1 geranylgeranyl diphosphate synthase type I [Jatrophihabitans sp. GAS493]
MTSRADTHPALLVIERARELVEPAMRAAIATLRDDQMRLISSYQMGWQEADGSAACGGGKALRPTLAVISAVAGGGSARDGVPGGIAVELVHNFSLIHDDVMDRDVERRHRPTAWTVFGDGQAILAGNAMLTVAFDVLIADAAAGMRALPCLTHSIHELISGQSRDLAYEGAEHIDLDACLQMEAGKTAALISASASIGALAAGASEEVVSGLAGYGFELGMAFQLVDDILGIVGDPKITGKSSSSDVRAGKRSAPVVAALGADGDAARQLGALLQYGPPSEEADVERATALIAAAGGLSWASDEADARLRKALAHLDGLPLEATAAEDLRTLARYVVDRDH